MNLEFENIKGTTKETTYKINQKIEEKEDKYVIKVEMIINKNKNGEKIIERMIKKQESPIVTELKEIERQRRKDMQDGKYERPMYEKEDINKQ